MLEAEADLKAVSMILGHSSPDLTTGVYQHVTTALKNSAIKSLPDLFGTMGPKRENLTV